VPQFAFYAVSNPTNGVPHATRKWLAGVTTVLALFDALLMVGVLAMSSALGYSVPTDLTEAATA